jgi:hypothetical protein
MGYINRTRGDNPLEHLVFSPVFHEDLEFEFVCLCLFSYTFIEISSSQFVALYSSNAQLNIHKLVCSPFDLTAYTDYTWIFSDYPWWYLLITPDGIFWLPWWYLLITPVVSSNFSHRYFYIHNVHVKHLWYVKGRIVLLYNADKLNDKYHGSNTGFPLVNCFNVCSKIKP